MRVRFRVRVRGLGLGLGLGLGCCLADVFLLGLRHAAGLRLLLRLLVVYQVVILHVGIELNWIEFNVIMIEMKFLSPSSPLFFFNQYII